MKSHFWNVEPVNFIYLINFIQEHYYVEPVRTIISEALALLGKSSLGTFNGELIPDIRQFQIRIQD